MGFFNRNRIPAGTPEFIVVGLGNPGSKYEATRHNTGFIFMDMLADKYGIKVNKIKFKADTKTQFLQEQRFTRVYGKSRSTMTPATLQLILID